MSRPRVVLILSCNYSGSHLLGQMLGAHSACADIGELRNLPKFAARRGPNASGTETRYFDDPLFAGFPRMPADQWHETLLARIRAQTPAVDVLIDNSKRLDWAARLVERADLDVRCLHLLRDPRALVRRWQEVFTEPRQQRRIRLREARRQWRRALQVLAAPEPQLYAWRWLRENEGISRFLAHHRPDASVLSYEELVAGPERALRSLMPALGLEFESQQLEYWRAPQYGTRKTQWSRPDPARDPHDTDPDVTVVGPPAAGRRTADGSSGDPPGAQQDGTARRLAADLRWQQELSPADAASVIARPELRDYVARCGYGFGPDGLEATARARGY